MNPTTYVFQVEHPGEPGAGIIGFTDTVTVTLDSGNPGGDEGEFEEDIRSYLAEWFDGAGVTLVPQKKPDELATIPSEAAWRGMSGRERKRLFETSPKVYEACRVAYGF